MLASALDVGAVVTPAASTVTAAAAIYCARRVQQGVDRVLATVEENEDRSLQNERLLLGSEAYDGVVPRLQRVEEEEETDV